MALLFIRTIVLYLLILLAMKLMGKREIGQLQPFELVVLLIISEMASLCMQSSTTPLIYSITPIVTISVLQILFSLANLKSEKLRHMLCGKPETLIEKGEFRQDTMARLRLNLNDLEELCRAQGYFDLSEISYAIMETNGSLSILPRTQKRPVQVGDMAGSIPEEQLSRLLVLDGHVNQQALQAAGRDAHWLEQQLKKKQIDHPKQAFLAGIDEGGGFFAQKKQKGENSHA